MKNTKEMNRTELVYELAKHAHPTWYGSLLGWKTSALRALVAHYRGELTVPFEMVRWPRIYRTKGLGDTRPTLEAAFIVEIQYVGRFRKHPQLVVRQIGNHGEQVIKL
jgi:hypothetical protein